MDVLIVIFHYGEYQKLWEQPFVVQAGPNIRDSPTSLFIPLPSIGNLLNGLKSNFSNRKYVLIHYTDPFILRDSPLLNLDNWKAPSLLACGDLHHGEDPIRTLSLYLDKEQHDAVILTFNPSLLEDVRSQLSIPVNSFPPSFFRYPTAKITESRSYSLIHIGSIGPYHARRAKIVDQLIQRNRIPFEHCTTQSADLAAAIYSKHALAINIPLNQDLNHRFFEIMSAGIPQIIFSNRSILGSDKSLANREDIFWASSIEEVEAITRHLFANKEYLMSIKVPPPPYITIQELIKKSFIHEQNHA